MTGPVEAAAGTWHDQAPAVAAAASTLLRLNEDHPDRPVMETYAVAAMRALDQRLDLQPFMGRMQYPMGPGWDVVTYASGQAPAELHAAALQLTQELYERRNVKFGVSSMASPTGEPVRVSRDQLVGVESLVQPYVEGFGIA